jgi:hypothetical protein
MPINRPDDEQTARRYGAPGSSLTRALRAHGQSCRFGDVVVTTAYLPTAAALRTPWYAVHDIMRASPQRPEPGRVTAERLLMSAIPTISHNIT